MRRDAQRNVDAILGAAVEVLAARPEASMADVATAAGVTRQTVYAHFPSREALMEAAVRRGLEEAVAAIDAAEPDAGPAADALERLVRAAWATIERYHRVVGAAEAVLGAEALRTHHEPVLERVGALVDRGRREGAFDDRLPREWLLASWIALQHAAAREVSEGRLPAQAAEAALVRTVQRAFAR